MSNNEIREKRKKVICDFDDIEGLNAYQIHPTHKAFGAFITPLRESRACIDYEY